MKTIRNQTVTRFYFLLSFIIYIGVFSSYSQDCNYYELFCGDFSGGSSYYFDTSGEGNDYGNEEYSNCISSSSLFDADDILFKYEKFDYSIDHITIFNQGGIDLDLFLLDNCELDNITSNPINCLDASITSYGAIDPNYNIDYLRLDQPGIYWIVVDGYNSSQVGPFYLSVSCDEFWDCAFDRSIHCGETYEDSTCPDPVVLTSNDKNNWYSCEEYPYYTGYENVHQFTAEFDGDFTFTLSDLTQDLDMFAIDHHDCYSMSGNQCIADSKYIGIHDEMFTINMYSGQTIYIVVDGYLDACSDYKLNVKCAEFNCDNAYYLYCGDELFDSNDPTNDLFPQTPITNSIDDHFCQNIYNSCEGVANTWTYSNPETLYKISNTSNATGAYKNNLCVDIFPTHGQDIDLFCYASCYSGSLEDCLAVSNQLGSLEDGIILEEVEPFEEFYALVDSKTGNSGSGDYKISVTCGNICNKAPTPIECGKQVLGTLEKSDENFNSYYCCADKIPFNGTYASTGNDGPEDVYSFEVSDDNTTIEITLNERNGSKDLQLFLMSDCLYQNCLIGATSPLGNEVINTTLDKGTYIVVVDGFNGAEGDYTLKVDGCNNFLGNICDVLLPIYEENFESYTPTINISNQNNNWYSDPPSGVTIEENVTSIQSQVLSLKGTSEANIQLLPSIHYPTYKLDFIYEIFYKTSSNSLNILPEARIGFLDAVLPDFVKSAYIEFGSDNSAKLYYETGGPAGQNKELITNLGDLFTKGVKTSSNKFRISWILEANGDIELYVNEINVGRITNKYYISSLSLWFENESLNGYIDVDDICLGACHKNGSYACVNSKEIKCERFDNYSSNTPVDLLGDWSNGGKGAACRIVDQGASNRALAITTLQNQECGAEYTIQDNTGNNSTIELSYDILISSNQGGGLQSIIETNDPNNVIFFNFINDELNYMIGNYAFMDYTKVNIPLDTYFTFRIQLNKANGDIKVYLADVLLNHITNTNYDKITKLYFDSALTANNQTTYIDNVCLNECQECNPQIPEYCSGIYCPIIVPVNDDVTTYTFEINDNLPDNGEWEIIETDLEGEETLVLQGQTGDQINYNCRRGKRYLICYKYLGADGCYHYCCFKLDLTTICNSIFDRFIGDENSSTFEYQIDNLTSSDSVAGWFISGANLGENTSVVYTYPNDGEIYVCCLIYNKITKCYRICCRRYCIQNPFICNGIIIEESNGLYQLSLDNQESIIEWTIDVPILFNNYIGNQNPQEFNPQTFGIQQGQEIVISVRYYDLDGCIKTCCKRITVGPQNNESLIIIPQESCVAPGQSVSIPVHVKNFNQIGAFGFKFELPLDSDLAFVSLSNSSLSNVQYNILSDHQMIISWDDLNGGYLDLQDDTKVFDILVLANNEFSTDVQLKGSDGSVLGQSINSIVLRSSIICLSEDITIRGCIQSPNNKNHVGVNVDFIENGTVSQSTITSTSGKYSFLVDSNEGFVKPEKDDQIKQGINIVDVARIRRHFLQTSFLDTDYKLIAGDVNKDGKVDIVDAALVNRVYLEKVNKFPNNTSWMFLPKHVDISSNPLSTMWPEFIDLQDAGINYEMLDFVSLKVGDVDHSAFLDRGSLDDTKRSNDIQISLPDTTASPGQSIALPIVVSDFVDVSIMSFEIYYDTSKLTFDGIEESKLAGFNNGSYNDTGGKIIVGWDHPQGEDQSVEGHLMNLIFTPKEGQDGLVDIEFDAIQAFDVNFSQYGVTAKNGSINILSSAIDHDLLFFECSAHPNPFRDKFELKISLNKQAPIRIELLTVEGDLIREIISEDIISEHVVLVSDINYSGLILCKINCEGYIFTKRLIQIK